MQVGISNLLGLMMRARKIDMGTAKIMDGIRKRKYTLVILANDASKQTRKQFCQKTEYYEVPLIEMGTKESIGAAIGKDIAVAVGLTDVGFTKKIYEVLEKTESSFR